MKIAFLTLLLSMGFLNATAQSDRPIRTTMVQIMANPDAFHGKLVSIKGFLKYEFEDHTLNLSKESAAYYLGMDFWVRFDTAFMKQDEIERYDKEYVAIIGIFDKNDKGHASASLGTVTSINYIHKLRPSKLKKVRPD